MKNVDKNGFRDLGIKAKTSDGSSGNNRAKKTVPFSFSQPPRMAQVPDSLHLAPTTPSPAEPTEQREVTIEKFPFNIHRQVRLKISLANSPSEHLLRMHFRPDSRNRYLTINIFPTIGNQANVTCQYKPNTKVKPITNEPSGDAHFGINYAAKNQSSFNLTLPDNASFSFTILEQSNTDLTLKIDKPKSHKVERIQPQQQRRAA